MNKKDQFFIQAYMQLTMGVNLQRYFQQIYHKNVINP